MGEPARFRFMDGEVGRRLAHRYSAVRKLSRSIAAPLSAEDQCVQSMPDASPTKWHLAHTTWFFEKLILQTFDPEYRPFDERYGYLFNSYYESLGQRHPRAQRGVLTRPSAEEVLTYRSYVDLAMLDFFGSLDDSPACSQAVSMIELAVHHEQQHQELMLTDIKHLLSLNPLAPVYQNFEAARAGHEHHIEWLPCPGGPLMMGHDGAGFAFDNESPQHRVLVPPFRIASRLINCGEYLNFIEDGGYRRPELWLSDGWRTVCDAGWQAPMYWEKTASGDWEVFTLAGRRPLLRAEPVIHVSFYEAAAYATWAKARLPTEFEWEAAARNVGIEPDMRSEASVPHPHPPRHGSGLRQMFGEAWQWTRSSYDPYPGFRAHEGPAAEYNGKFMVGQLVLRGSSCATPPGHARISYRNYFPPATRWQFAGIRLARDV